MDNFIAIGDIHGENFWNLHNPNLFIGDYWDSFFVPFFEQKENFLNIIQYLKDNPETIALLGNHDLHYLLLRERYSGYQRDKAREIEELLYEHLDLFQVAYETDNHIFSHAGLTNTWMETYGCKSVKDVNDLFKEDPKAFGFQGLDMTGNDITQGPMWVRPQSLDRDFWGNKKQVVGHTGVRKIVEQNNIILIDNQEKKPLIIKQENL